MVVVAVVVVVVVEEMTSGTSEVRATGTCAVGGGGACGICEARDSATGTFTSNNKEFPPLIPNPSPPASPTTTFALLVVVVARAGDADVVVALKFTS